MTDLRAAGVVRAVSLGVNHADVAARFFARRPRPDPIACCWPAGTRSWTAYGYAHVPAALLDRVQALQDICIQYGVPPLAAAIQFAFGHPAVATVVVGARAPHEVTDNAALLAHPIPPELWNHMKAARLLPQEAPVPPPDV